MINRIDFKNCPVDFRDAWGHYVEIVERNEKLGIFNLIPMITDAVETGSGIISGNGNMTSAAKQNFSLHDDQAAFADLKAKAIKYGVQFKSR